MAEPTLLELVFVLGQRLNQLVDVTLAETPLDHFDLALYGAIVSSGSITASELAERLAVPRTTVLDRLRSIDQRGHLYRIPHPSDGRATQLALTESGRQAWEATNAAWEPMWSAFESQLRQPASEIATALRSLEAAAAAVAADLAGRRPTRRIG